LFIFFLDLLPDDIFSRLKIPCRMSSIRKDFMGAVKIAIDLEVVIEARRD